MAAQPDDENSNILDLTDKLDEPTEPQDDAPEADDPETPDSDDDEGDGEQPTVTFGDEEEPEPEPNSVIRQMRQELRETKRKLAEVEKAAAPKPIEIGKKPDLWEDCEGDPDKFEAELDAWKARKAAADRDTEAQAEQNRKANEDWQNDLGTFQAKKAALQFADRDEAIDNATAALNPVQQAVIVKAAADPALFLYALNKSPAKMAEIAKFQDPIKLAAAVARMEGSVKVTNRKAPEPDRPLRGSTAMPGGADKELERLEKEAERTGNRTKVIAHKRKVREAAAK